MTDVKVEAECLDLIRRANELHEEAANTQGKTRKKILKNQADVLEKQASDLMEKSTDAETTREDPGTQS